VRSTRWGRGPRRVANNQKPLQHRSTARFQCLAPLYHRRPYPPCCAWRTSPAIAVEDEKARVLAAPMRAKSRSPDGAQRNPGTTVTLICRPGLRCASSGLRRKRKAERREAHHPLAASADAAARLAIGALAFRRSTATFVAALTPQLSPRPRFLRLGSRECYPRPPVPVQRAPRGPVVMPAKRNPRASRERGHDSRPQASPLLHFRDRLEKRPS
jgi:hypothetical protein